MGSIFDSILLRHAPCWYRTPVAQTVCLGLVFFLVFAAYTTIQFYASSNYGPVLAANSVSAVYFFFTLSCCFAPTIINHQLLESRQAMLVGIMGYATLVVCSLAYFEEAAPPWVVIMGGAVLGVGAALLWTAQGQLVLAYAAAEGNNNTARLMGIFWAVFQCSSLVGGAISFAYYNNNQDEQPTGSSLLYVIFLSFILLGALLTQFLLPPSMLLTTTAPTPTPMSNDVDVVVEDESTGLLLGAASDTATIKSESHTTVWDSLSSTWSKETKHTLRFFVTQPMLVMSILFFYTGFNQPYQQATYNRFFTKRSIGIELILFHAMEIVSALCVGRVLDDDPIQQNNKEEEHHHHVSSSLQTKKKQPMSRQRRAVGCLVLFAAINLTANVFAFLLEFRALNDGLGEQLRVVDVGSSLEALGPSIAFLLWGFADAQIQVYCYWWIGSLMYSVGDDHSRAVGFYKLTQSMGYTLGFYLTPTQTRLSGMHQLVLSTSIFVAGTAMALYQTTLLSSGARRD